MVRISRTAKTLIALVIIAAAFAFAVKQSNILTKGQQKLYGTETSEYLKKYDNAQNVTKVKIDIRTTELSKIRNKIDNVFHNFNLALPDECVRPDLHMLITSVPDSINKQFINSITQVAPGATIQKSTTPAAGVAQDIATRIRDIDFLKAKSQELINRSNISNTQYEFYKNEITGFQAQIESLNALRGIQQTNRNYNLVFVSIFNTPETQLSQIAKLRSFVKWLFVALIGLTLLALVLYGFLMLVFKGMSLLGISTSRAVSRYGYNYGYGYGYSRRNKRKYKKVSPEELERMRAEEEDED